jgi:hypothetical protein
MNIATIVQGDMVVYSIPRSVWELALGTHSHVSMWLTSRWLPDHCLTLAMLVRNMNQCTVCANELTTRYSKLSTARGRKHA